MNGEPNGWNAYKLFVMEQLKGLTERSTRIENKLDRLNTKVTVLETKSLMYGAIAGFVIAAAVQIVAIVIKIS